MNMILQKNSTNNRVYRINNKSRLIWIVLFLFSIGCKANIAEDQVGGNDIDSGPNTQGPPPPNPKSINIGGIATVDDLTADSINSLNWRQAERIKNSLSKKITDNVLTNSDIPLSNWSTLLDNKSTSKPPFPPLRTDSLPDEKDIEVDLDYKLDGKGEKEIDSKDKIFDALQTDSMKKVLGDFDDDSYPTSDMTGWAILPRHNDEYIQYAKIKNDNDRKNSMNSAHIDKYDQNKINKYVEKKQKTNEIVNEIKEISEDTSTKKLNDIDLTDTFLQNSNGDIVTTLFKKGKILTLEGLVNLGVAVHPKLDNTKETKNCINNLTYSNYLDKLRYLIKHEILDTESKEAKEAINELETEIEFHKTAYEDIQYLNDSLERAKKKYKDIDIEDKYDFDEVIVTNDDLDELIENDKYDDTKFEYSAYYAIQDLRKLVNGEKINENDYRNCLIRLCDDTDTKLFKTGNDHTKRLNLIKFLLSKASKEGDGVKSQIKSAITSVVYDETASLRNSGNIHNPDYKAKGYSKNDKEYIDELFDTFLGSKIYSSGDTDIPEIGVYGKSVNDIKDEHREKHKIAVQGKKLIDDYRNKKNIV